MMELRLQLSWLYQSVLGNYDLVRRLTDGSCQAVLGCMDRRRATTTLCRLDITAYPDPVMYARSDAGMCGWYRTSRRETAIAMEISLTY